MSASRRACQDAVSEWSHMGRYPAPEDIVGKRQLIDAVQRWAADDAHAEEIARRLLDTCKFCPVPADIREAASAVRPLGTNSSAGCKRCGGTGWISRDVVKADGRYPYSSPCSCRPAPDWGALGERGTGELQKVAIEVGDE
jgi:hypothetical protein